jgi:hypothetical protein
MKNKSIAILVPVALLFTSFFFGQEKGWEKLELPRKTLEYKLRRALINQVGQFILGIAYAKTKGDSPEDIAAYGLKCWGSWWKDKDYSYYVRKWYNVFSTDTEFKMEILTETEDKIDLKMNIFGERYIETYAESGVTKEEYVRFLGTMLSSMAEYMGFEHKLKIKEDWIYLSIIKK